MKRKGAERQVIARTIEKDTPEEALKWALGKANLIRYTRHFPASRSDKTTIGQVLKWLKWNGYEIRKIKKSK